MNTRKAIKLASPLALLAVLPLLMAPSGGIPSYITFSGITMRHGTISDPLPIAQNASFGEPLSSFPGQYYTDISPCWGYNLSCGASQSPGWVSASDWADGLILEQDYAHNALPWGATGSDTNVGSVTVAGAVLTDTGQTWTANQLKFESLYDVTHPGSCLINSNTATSITCNVAIAGWANGDTYQVMRRDGEEYFTYTFSGMTGGRATPIFFGIDKGRTLATNTLHMISNFTLVPSDPGYGYEFIADDCTTVHPGACGGGSHDVAQINLQGIDVYGDLATDTHVIVHAVQSGKNAKLYLNAYNDINGLWLTEAGAGRALLQQWNAAGSAAETVADCSYGGTCQFGNATAGTTTNIVGPSAANTQANGNPIVTEITGTVSMTYSSGGCTSGTITPTVTYYIQNHNVLLYFTAANCTASVGTWTVAGLPAALEPSHIQNFLVPATASNSPALADCSIAVSGTSMTCVLLTGAAGTVTGFAAGTSSYLLN